MTAIIARLPLQDLPMSKTQTGSRRLSARLQEKDGPHTQNNGGSDTLGASQGKKRKNGYEEDDDGFAFSRVKKHKKPRHSVERSEVNGALSPAIASVPLEQTKERRKVPANTSATPKKPNNGTVSQKERRKRMSFSTPAKEERPLRRSKRLSSEAVKEDERLVLNTEKVNTPRKAKVSSGQAAPEIRTQTVELKQTPKANKIPPETTSKRNESEIQSVPEDSHASTKISLPFADTPVISRNKAMREGRGSKGGDRRSSLGFRGRRASSLIETGTSNALPHQEVDVAEFYKHIEIDMLEPRRMKQLLTWCGTRALHSKRKGTDTNDSGPISAARIIEEELLKEMANNSELSDWFSREEAPVAIEPLPERPNPKNTQNSEKIAELELQIQRLRNEKAALEAVLRPPKITVFEHHFSDTKTERIDRNLLSEDDAALLDNLHSSTNLSANISRRLEAITSSIEPAVDRLADGIHKIAQYRKAADNVANRVLSICSDRILQREKEGRKKALHIEDDRSPGRDLSSVLRGLSKVDQ